jgi:hypothetical protein
MATFYCSDTLSPLTILYYYTNTRESMDVAHRSMGKKRNSGCVERVAVLDDSAWVPMKMGTVSVWHHR